MTDLASKEWMQKISNFKFQISNYQEVIVCPSYTLLPILKSYILNHKSKIELGAQDISAYPQGAYTGEVNGKQIAEFAKYVLIGHSERREYFKETEDMVAKKVHMALKNNIKPIVCVENEETPIPLGVALVAYEPVGAIGSGNADTPDNAESVAKAIKETHKQVMGVLYGGSVTAENVKSFTAQEHIDGVLVGKASLDPQVFSRIIQNA